MSDYATSVLAFAGAARLAVHRGDRPDVRTGNLARAMRARRRSRSCCRPWPCVCVSNSRWSTARSKRHRGSAPAQARSTTSSSIGPPGMLRRRGCGPPPDVVDEPRDASGRGQLAAHAGRAPPAAVPADAPDDRRDRRTAVHLAQYGELRGRLDLPSSVFRLASMAVQQATAVGLLGGLAASVAWQLRQRLVDVVSECQGHLRGSSDDVWEPDDGNDADSTSTISAAVAPASTDASVWAPYDGPAPPTASAASRVRASVFASSC